MNLDSVDKKVRKFILLKPQLFAEVTMQACTTKMKDANAQTAAKYLVKTAETLMLCSQSLLAANNKVVEFKK